MKEITSHTNEYIKMLKSLKQKKSRDEEKKYIIEGDKIIVEALNAEEPIECIIVSDKKSGFIGMAERQGVEVLHVPHEIIQQIADTKSPPKDLACLRMQHKKASLAGRFYIAVDDVNDPKNLGTIIRTADAAGADGVFVSATSADYFGPKAQRAAMGSTFHMDVEVCDLPHKLKELKRHGITIISGDLSGSETLETGFEKACIVIGNEARGISEDVRKLSDVLYKIKIYGRAESLNASVAAGIMMYDVRRLMKGKMENVTQ